MLKSKVLNKFENLISELILLDVSKMDSSFEGLNEKISENYKDMQRSKSYIKKVSSDIVEEMKKKDLGIDSFSELYASKMNSNLLSTNMFQDLGLGNVNQKESVMFDFGRGAVVVPDFNISEAINLGTESDSDLIKHYEKNEDITTVESMKLSKMQSAFHDLSLNCECNDLMYDHIKKIVDLGQSNEFELTKKDCGKLGLKDASILFGQEKSLIVVDGKMKLRNTDKLNSKGIELENYQTMSSDYLLIGEFEKLENKLETHYRVDVTVDVFNGSDIEMKNGSVRYNALCGEFSFSNELKGIDFASKNGLEFKNDLLAKLKPVLMEDLRLDSFKDDYAYDLTEDGLPVKLCKKDDLDVEDFSGVAFAHSYYHKQITETYLDVSGIPETLSFSQMARYRAEEVLNGFDFELLKKDGQMLVKDKDNEVYCYENDNTTYKSIDMDKVEPSFLKEAFDKGFDVEIKSLNQELKRGDKSKKKQHRIIKC